MKDITLKITGFQCFDNQDEENVEFITEGKFYRRGEAVYIVYDETEICGMAGCKTVMKIKDDTVKMRRTGNGGEEQSQLYFERGNRFNGIYDTPYGPINVEILTSMVENKLDYDQGKGQVNVDYKVSLEGMAEGKNRLVIDVN